MKYHRRRAVALGIIVLIGWLIIVGPRLPSSDSNDLPAAFTTEAPTVRHFTVEASGDLLIHSPVWAEAAALAGGTGYDFAPMFTEIRPYVRGADLALCHVETPMSTAPPTSYPIFNSPPELAAGIAATGWQACDTASNHSVDYAQEGIDQTGHWLDRAGVAHNGSFPSAAAQRKPLILPVAGLQLGFLGYTTDLNGNLDPHPWSVNLASPPAIARDVRRDVAAGADGVIVNLQWGGAIVPEYQADPSAGQLALARKVAALPGVIAIVAQGPHVVQPIRWINDKPVVFSEGNLISNQGAEAGLPVQTQDGLIALLHFVARGDKIHAQDVRYVPTYVRHPDYRVLPVGPALARGEDDATLLRDSYARTVAVVGRDSRVAPIPRRLPG